MRQTCALLNREILKKAQKFRNYAKILTRRSKILKQEANVLFDQGDVQEAIPLHGKAKAMQMDIDKLHMEAAKLYFNFYNPNIRSNYNIDLHGLRANEARMYLEMHVQSILRRRQNFFQVIVGKGTHSVLRPVLTMVVKDFCKEKNYSCEEIELGVWHIDLNKTHKLTVNWSGIF